MLIHESKKAVYDFFQAILTKNNKAIDESVVIKVLDAILTDDNDPFVTTIPENTILYRAREIDTPADFFIKENGFTAYYDENNVFHCSGYNSYGSKEPPLDISSAGRSNIAGMSYLYLAGEPYTACSEIKPDNWGLISLATFKASKDMRIVNFYDAVHDYDKMDFVINYDILPHIVLKEIYSIFAAQKRSGKEYVVTQFISDYVRKAGFDGIKYWGSTNYGTCYTIFNSHKSNIAFVESKIIINAGVKYNLIDLEKGSKIESSQEEATVDIANIQKSIVKYIRQAGKETENG